MELISSFREAVLNLLSAKLRSFLAILGVLVGTGSVVALISSSQLATAHALAQFKSLGTNLISLYIRDDESGRQSNQAQSFSYQDALLLKKKIPQIEMIAPYTMNYESLYFSGKALNGELIGATDTFGKIAKTQLSSGRFISYLDHRALYCVIGEKVAKKILSFGANPLYNQIRVGNNMLTIVGILKKWPENLFISADLNSSVIIPLPTSYLLNSKAKISNVLIRLSKQPNVTLAKQQITATMKILLPKKQLVFNSPEQLIDLIAKQRQTYTWLLVAIGSISLVVGGIGVMNIMLVSVVERRREIGIRMAIGARQNDILRMFLIESVMLTIFGGFLGVLIGVLTSYVLVIFTHWQFYFYFTPVLLGFAVSVLVGILSGFYPAWRASKLNPIQALAS
ncbi:MAG: ABC transporter substrate-binding protein [Gammaproteobacteria bacterium CG_4_10_14_0_8_um_filter_38_16]|nr:MAG: ABC transporter substrate-binding protein [Gammaproteobacteria bacterium CG_4_10_14_0_8_um_filter_38_16]PJA03858.1 MAG: ABC transporter substrate-binding protein [Gammaproteobacteria bacterium CG_4_10_14_0_2_um_filter_38_22]PJB10831.1 MAG: ABC transporter substrate-binding protein [Gammaproteobacteria bacterium CG_4_9_14_3_um_filter_38_9]